MGNGDQNGTDHPADLRGLMEFCQHHPTYQPLVLCEEAEIKTVERLQIQAMPWRTFLIQGPLLP